MPTASQSPLDSTSKVLLVIDGIDAVGKSTLCQSLALRLRCNRLDEFSDSVVGASILKIVSAKRYFRLTEDFATPVADMFAILSDATYKYEMPLGGLTISDRGIISAIAYQVCRLGIDDADKVELLSHEILRTVRTACPAVLRARHINLRIDEDLMQRRITGRGESPLGPDHLRFFSSVQCCMTVLARELDAVTVDMRDESVEATCDRIAYALS